MTTEDKTFNARIHVQCDGCDEWFAPAVTKHPGQQDYRLRCGDCRTTHHFNLGEIGGSV